MPPQRPIRTRTSLGAAFCSLLSTLALVSVSPAEIPKLIQYQGRITEDEAPLDGEVEIRFSIYPDSLGTSPLWQETRRLSASSGQFSALLGSADSIPSTLFDRQELYLGITIGQDPELLPLQRIVSVGYAFRAAEADNVHDRNITPASLTIAGTGYSLSAEGDLRVRTVSADSIALAGTPVVVAPAGLTTDTLIVRSVADTLTFSAEGTWRALDELTTFLHLPGLATVEFHFAGAVSAHGGFEVRLVLEPLDPSGEKVSTIANVSGMPYSGNNEFRASGVSNLGVRSLEAGLYRLFVERRVSGSRAGKLHTGTLLIRVNTR